jgi:hypothetical protein
METKAKLLEGLQDLIAKQKNIEDQKMLFLLIDPNVLYLQEIQSSYRILRFYTVDKISNFWPIPLFKILATNLHGFPKKDTTNSLGEALTIIEIEDFSKLKIIEKKDLPLYVSGHVTPEFEQLLKGE